MANNLTQQLEQLDEQGFTFIENFLSPEQLTSVNGLEIAA